MRVLALLLGVLGLPAHASYDANGVKLGASEKDVKRAFPTAFCKPLEWKSAAADRRCDDARMTMAGVDGRITFYLRNDAVQAFDVRFDTRDAERLAGALKSRYGKPSLEARDKVARRGGGEAREVLKVVWESGRDRAALVSQLDGRRSQLSVSRGNFEEEIYRVK